MARKWIFAAAAIAATSAKALPEMQIATAEDMARLEVGFNAILAKTYREKVLTCAAPEWADQVFIQECIESAINNCASSPVLGTPAPCINGQNLKTH